MMSVKKKSRLRPIWGCLCSVAWATCSGIIRLSLKISSGFFGVVSLVPWLSGESSVLGVPLWESPVATLPRARWDLGWEQLCGDTTGLCWAGRADPASLGAALAS